MDLEAVVLAALSSLPCCSQSAFEQEELPLPVIVAAQDNCRVLARADGMPYLEEMEITLHVYAKTLTELKTLSLSAHEAVTALGLSCLSQARDHDETAWAHHLTLRYRAVLCGDTIYQ